MEILELLYTKDGSLKEIILARNSLMNYKFIVLIVIVHGVKLKMEKITEIKLKIDCLLTTSMVILSLE